MRRLVLVVGLSACGFTPITLGAMQLDGNPGAEPVPLDAYEPRTLYANSDQMLYRVDVDAKTATLVGPIGQSINGLAELDGVLLGIPASGTSLVTIDPATAQVTHAVDLSSTGTYYALAVGAGTIYAASPNSTGNNVYTVGTDGTVTPIGSFGGGRQVAGDLAWHDGELYVTLEGPGCNSQCIARVNLSTGAATPFITNAPNDCWALSGYRGKLWVLRGSGDVMLVDTVGNTLMQQFNASSINWWEAAE